MKILSCFHTIADLDLLSEDDWTSGSMSAYIDTCYLKRILNFYDEIALELARRLMEQEAASHSSCTCTAVSIGGQECRPFMEGLAALGFQETDLILLRKGHSIEGLSSEKTAALLYSYIEKQTPFDYIFTGSQSGDGGQGKVPYLLAEHLGIPCISNVIGLQALPDGKLLVRSLREDMLCEQTITPPSLLVFGDIARCFLQVPTLRQKMQTRKQMPTLYREEELLANPKLSPLLETFEQVELVAMEAVLQQRDSEIFPVQDSKEAAKKLFDYYKEWI